MTHNQEDENDATAAGHKDALPSAASSAAQGGERQEDSEIFEAEMVVAEAIEEPMIIDAIALPPSSFAPEDRQEVHSKPEVVAGSPFAQTDPSAAAAARKNVIPSESYAAKGAATAALGLGVLSLLSSWFSALALFPCLFGIVMGFWGANSAFRRRAIVGLVMSLLAVAVTMTFSVFRTVIAESNPVPSPTPRVTLVSDGVFFLKTSVSDARHLKYPTLTPKLHDADTT